MDVIVLDGNEVPNPEDMAMIQALYSRSPQSVRTHLEKVKETAALLILMQTTLMRSKKKLRASKK